MENENVLIQNNTKTKLSIKKQFIFIIMIIIPIILLLIIIFKTILYPIFKIKCELNYKIKQYYYSDWENGKNCEKKEVRYGSHIEALIINLSCPSSKSVEESLLYSINEVDYVKNGEIAIQSNDKFFTFTISSKFLLDIKYSVCTSRKCYNGKKGDSLRNENEQLESISICLK